MLRLAYGRILKDLRCTSGHLSSQSLGETRRFMRTRLFGCFGGFLNWCRTKRTSKQMNFHRIGPAVDEFSSDWACGSAVRARETTLEKHRNTFFLLMLDCKRRGNLSASSMSYSMFRLASFWTDPQGFPMHIWSTEALIVWVKRVRFHGVQRASAWLLWWFSLVVCHFEVRQNGVH